MKYNLTIGDWSNDGHNQTEVYVVEIPDQFKDVLKSNFESNVKRIGFDPTELAQEYEDSSISEDEIEALRRTGFDFEKAVTKYSDYPIYIDNRQIAGPDGMLAILMHFIGYGLEGFTYEVISDSFPQLFGYWDSAVISSHKIGYGLFY